MSMTKRELWQRYLAWYRPFPKIGLSLDFSRMPFPDGYFGMLEPQWRKAREAMRELEKGAIANPDEKRMVGHYWLRNPALAPTPEIRRQIEGTGEKIKAFVDHVHKGVIHGAQGSFKNCLVIGIGGSALGPQFVANALGQPKTDRLRMCFFDNTDPDGMDRVLDSLAGELGRTLTVVISKSGGTKETRNGMLEAQRAYERAGLSFAGHAVAVTGEGSELDVYAQKNQWRERFPMWDWVGGRTSETSAVGLLPAALQGLDIDELLLGAGACDELTRLDTLNDNPAGLLACSWLGIVNGKGEKDMVVLPYKDRLELFSKYLQQLIMESLGKERDLNGQVVNQGIAVYGNKGSTDQHAYIQQLRDGVNNFFVTFIEVLRDRTEKSEEVEPDVTSGDYLVGFLHGTRQALFENNRHSITITCNEMSAFTVGVLIALYERAVGYYASFVNINAYHQPGVEAGKKAATDVIRLQRAALKVLRASPRIDLHAAAIADKIGEPEAVEVVFKVCQHLAANPERGVRANGAVVPSEVRFSAV